MNRLSRRTASALLPRPVLYVLWFRPGRGRWTKVGRYSTRAEALTEVGSSGDWWISELSDPDRCGERTGLFDETEHLTAG